MGGMPTGNAAAVVNAPACGCGSALASGDRFCGSCGAPAPAPARAGPVAAQPGARITRPGLRDVSVDDFELLTPGTADFGDHLGAELNGGSPGHDPYPRLERGGELRLVDGERTIGAWVAHTLHRSINYPMGPPDAWATDERGWLHEEMASQGHVHVVLTNLRVYISVPCAYVNDQTYERVIRPVHKRGEGPAIKPTVKDRMLMTGLARVGRGSGAIGRTVRDLVGDGPPRAGHLALDSVRAVGWSDSRRRGAVLLETVVWPDVDRSDHRDSQSIKLLTVELGVSAGLGAHIATGLVDALDSRGPTGDIALPPSVGPARRLAGGQLYEPSAFRPIGSDRTCFAVMT